MKWQSVLIIAVVVIVFILLKKAGQISSKDAQSHLGEGAMVIDVRSPGEFSSGHLESAINIPLDQIENILPNRVKDKDQPLLLHCQSGMRSGIAAKKAKTMGYTKVHNLGSLSRARKIVEKSSSSPTE